MGLKDIVDNKTDSKDSKDNSNTSSSDDSGGIEQSQEKVPQKSIKENPEQVLLDDLTWDDTEECRSCGRESPKGVDPFKGDELWYYRCPAPTTECPVTTFTVSSYTQGDFLEGIDEDISSWEEVVEDGDEDDFLSGVDI